VFAHGPAHAPPTLEEARRQGSQSSGTSAAGTAWARRRASRYRESRRFLTSDALRRSLVRSARRLRLNVRQYLHEVRADALRTCGGRRLLLRGGADARDPVETGAGNKAVIVEFKPFAATSQLSFDGGLINAILRALLPRPWSQPQALATAFLPVRQRPLEPFLIMSLAPPPRTKPVNAEKSGVCRSCQSPCDRNRRAILRRNR